MITLYTTPSSASCRKAKSWLEENNLPFIEKNNIETFKRIEGIGVQLKRPQVFTAVYLYQRWLIENPR